MTTETKPKPTTAEDIGKALREPFHPDDIEWRIGQAGKGDKGIWAKVLAYVTNRAIMYRLDDVLGVDGWKVRYRPWHLIGSSHSQICELSLRIGGEWIAKEDGADCTDIESVKGGLSDAMKRAAVQFGIGRYLYSLEEGWAEISTERQPWPFRRTHTKDLGTFFWAPPKLDDWALPVDMRKKDPETKQSPPAAKPQEKPADKPKSMTEMNEAMAESKRIAAKATLAVAEAQTFARLDELQDAIDARKTEKLLGAGDYDKLLVALLERRVQLAETPEEIGIAESQVASFKEKRRIDSTQAEVWGGNLANKRGRAYAE